MGIFSLFKSFGWNIRSQLHFYYVLTFWLAVISCAPVICGCSDLNTSTVTVLLMLPDDGSGIWTEHSRMACLRSVMFGAQLGRCEWLLVTQKAEGQNQLEASSLTCQAHGLSWDHPLSPDTWTQGAGSKKKHPEKGRSKRIRGRAAQPFLTQGLKSQSIFYSNGRNRYKPAQIQGKRPHTPPLRGTVSKKLRSFLKKPYLSCI